MRQVCFRSARLRSAEGICQGQVKHSCHGHASHRKASKHADYVLQITQNRDSGRDLASECVASQIQHCKLLQTIDRLVTQRRESVVGSDWVRDRDRERTDEIIITIVQRASSRVPPTDPWQALPHAPWKRATNPGSYFQRHSNTAKRSLCS